MFSRSIALSIVITAAAMGSGVAAPNCAAVKQSQGCSCVVPLPQTPIGRLSNLGGDIKRTSQGSYTPIRVDTDINVGDGLLFGKDGHAFLTAGPDCQNLKLGSFTSVVVRAVEGCACITSVDSGGAPIVPLAAGGAGGSGAAAPLIIVGGGAGGILLFSSQDTQDSN